MNTVVYYPHQTPSPKWLKLASLCWDKVYRLTPDNFKDPTEVQELDNALGGMLASINIPDLAADAQVQESFKAWAIGKANELRAKTDFYWEEKPYGDTFNKEWTKQQLQSEKNISEVYEQIPIVYAEIGKKDEDAEWVHLSSSKFGGEHYKTVKFDFVSFLETLGLAKVEIHPLQLRVPQWNAEYVTRYHGMRNALPNFIIPEPGSAHEMYNRLRARGLIQEAEKIYKKNLVTVTPEYASGTTAVYMPKEVALHYLSLCALKAATDDKRDLAAVDEKFTDVVFSDIQAIKGEVATTLLEAYLPANFYSLTLERIVEIKFELATQRLKYDNAVQSLCKEFAAVASEGELGKLNGRIIEMAKERVEDTRNTYKRAKLQTMIQSLGVSLTPPALVGSVASFLGIGIFAPAGIAAALSIFAAKSFLDWDKAKVERTKNPWSYVIDVSKKAGR